MVFKLWKKLDSAAQVIKALWAVIGLLVFINLLAFWGWYNSPKDLRIYVAPSQIASGALIKPGVVPRSIVYAFAFQIFSALNTWSFGGQKDYQKGITTYRHYESSSFYEQLKDDYLTRQGNGSLDRIRSMTGFSGMGYKPNDVRLLGPGVWEVLLKMRVVERVGNTVVKDVLIDYPIRVTKSNLSIALNPWGLVLDGYVSPPKRVKTFV